MAFFFFFLISSLHLTSLVFSIIDLWAREEKLPQIKILSLLHTTICAAPPTFQKIRCFWNMTVQAERLIIQMQLSWQVIYFCICVLCSKSLWLCVDFEWCNPFQRILGLQWGWQSVLLVCDWQRWGSQGRLGSSCQTHTHTPVVLCCPLLVSCFTATLGLAFQATLSQGNYLQRVRQQQIWWVQP